MIKFTRVLAMSLLFLAFATLLTTVVVAALPYLRNSSRVSDLEVQDYPEYKALGANLESEMRTIPKLKAKSEVGHHRLNWLTNVEFVVTAKREINGGPVAIGLGRPGELKLRYDRLLGTSVLLTAVALGFWFVERRGSTSAPIPPTSASFAISNLREMLMQEIVRLDLHCAYQARRSRYLLIGGIITAIAGIGVLYFFVSAREAQSGLNDLAVFARAFAVVLYVEAFAFLLLRQYRLSEEDYRYFNSKRLGEVRYLMSLQAVTEKIDLGDDPTLPRCFLAEDPFRGTGSAKGGEDPAQSQNALEQLARQLLAKDGFGKEAQKASP